MSRTGLEYEGSSSAAGNRRRAGRGANVWNRRFRSRRCPTRVVCAGRTDAGVHALAQVVHFDTEAVRPDSAWVRGTNAHLPASVAVRWAQPVSNEFHARFSARGRHYRYLLLNRPERPGLLARRVGWFHRPLDARHGGAAVCSWANTTSRPSARSVPAGSPVKILRRAGCTSRRPVGIRLRASAFLHHMVRNLVGALVYVGKGAHAAWLGNCWRAIAPARRRLSKLAASTLRASIMIRSGN